MMNSIIFMWITIIVNILGWFILHILSKRRDLSNKKNEITIQYLITAWQLLENASNRNDGTRNADVEKAIANIQLFGTPTQIQLAQKLSDEIGDTQQGDTKPLLIELRKELRKELELEVVGDKLRHFRFNKKAL